MTGRGGVRHELFAHSWLFVATNTRMAIFIDLPRERLARQRGLLTVLIGASLIHATPPGSRLFYLLLLYTCDSFGVGAGSRNFSKDKPTDPSGFTCVQKTFCCHESMNGIFIICHTKDSRGSGVFQTGMSGSTDG